jgi:hypothetical protein
VLPRLNIDSKDTLSYSGYFLNPNEITNNMVNISGNVQHEAWLPLPYFDDWNKNFAEWTRKNDF